MAKYVLAYHGGGGMPETPEETERLMAEWGAWFGSMGDAVVDGGNPFGRAKTISPDGSIADGAGASAGGAAGCAGFGAGTGHVRPDRPGRGTGLPPRRQPQPPPQKHR